MLKFLIIIALWVGSIATTAQAQEPIQAHHLDINAFAQIPILHEGQIGRAHV